MNSLGRNLLLLLILSLAWNCSYSQQPYSISLGDIRPLPDKVVYSILQDNKGYVWTSTNKGLFKYDGFKHTLFSSQAQTSVAGGNIREDKYGRIWYQNFDGYLYYVKDGQLLKLGQNLPPDYTSYGITSKWLFVIQKAGVDVFDLKTLKLVRTIPMEFTRLEHSMAMGDFFYVVADHKMHRVDADGKKLTSNYFEGKGLHIKYIYNKGEQLYIASKNNETQKIYFFDKNLTFLKDQKIPKLARIQGSDVIDNQIWLHSSNGTYLMDEPVKSSLDFNILPNSSVSQVIKDYQGNLWVSTINNGIYLIKSLKERVFNLESYSPKTIMSSKDGFILSTEDGQLLELDAQFRKKRKIFQEESRVPIYYVYHDKIDNNLLFSHNGFSLLNTVTNKRDHYDIALKEAVRLDEKYYAIASSGMFGLLKNPNAPAQASSIWDKKFNSIERTDIADIAPLKTHLRAKSVSWDASGKQLLITSNLGTFLITANEEREIKNGQNTFYAQKVVFRKGMAYLLDTKGQLFRLKSDFSLENLSLLWNINAPITLLRQDSSALIWRTNELAYRFDSNRITTQSISNYLTVLDLWFDNENLNLLTDKNVVHTAIKKETKNTPPRFYIDSLKVNGRIRADLETSQLKYNENHVALHFSVLEFIDKKIDIKYRINGQKWLSIPSEQRTLEFPSLSAGKYLIEFKLNQQINPKKISFTIELPFWRQWIFYLIGSLSLVGIILYYYSRRSKYMQRQIDLLDEKITLERNLRSSVLTSIKSQMNPHFFYNALNTIQAYIFTNDRDRASNYLAKFSKLTRMILEMSEKESITLTEEMTALTLYLELEQMRFSENFQFQIDLDPNLNKEEIELPPMLLQPYIENAVKHGLLHKSGEKHLHIRMKMEGDTLLVDIEDNGIGRHRSAELNSIKNKNHTSFATQANERRIEILNKGRLHKIGIEIIDLKDSSQQSSGTRVSLRIPLN